MVSCPVTPRGHSRFSVRASISVTSELSANLMVSDITSVWYQSHSRNSLPMKSRLLSSAIHATSDGVTPGTNVLGAESSTSRVREFTSAS